MNRSNDARFMRMALALGRRGLGRVAPWPSVGCVLVRNGRVVGRGVTDRQTMRHAEVVALDHAGPHARGATAYVTLEPCSHRGTVGPCADALIQAGVERVVAALTDPNPKVSGKGLARLRAAGIPVETGLFAEEAEADHAGFLKVQRVGLPMVTLKLAMSLDGRIATATGESQWITGPDARRFVHGMRANHDAVMVGGGTARADDPTLTVRGLGVSHQPTRVVVSGSLTLPIDGALARSARSVPLVLCHRDSVDASAWEALGARSVPCTKLHGRVDMTDALRKLAEAGHTRVLCEGGGGLAASILDAGLVDRLVVFSAGKVIGAEGLPAVAALGLDALALAPNFNFVEQRAIGGDLVSFWTRSQAS